MTILPSVPPTTDTADVGIPGGSSALRITNNITTVATPRRAIRRVTFNRNTSTFQQGDTDRTIEALVSHVKDLQRALDDLYSRGMAVAAEEVDSQGFPAHGAICSALDGQYIHIFRPNTGMSNLVAVQHGLGRVPQGAICVYDEGINTPTACIAGSWDRISSENIPAATSNIIYFRYGISTNQNDRTIFVLF